jgi:hypothetical protein
MARTEPRHERGAARLHECPLLGFSRGCLSVSFVVATGRCCRCPLCCRVRNGSNGAYVVVSGHFRSRFHEAINSIEPISTTQHAKVFCTQGGSALAHCVTPEGTEPLAQVKIGEKAFSGATRVKLNPFVHLAALDMAISLETDPWLGSAASFG